MKNNPILQFMAICIALSVFTFGCNPATDTASKAAEATKEAAKEMAAAKPDMAKVKAEIQAVENAWATASNTKDVATISAFYAEDAVSMPANLPILMGKAAIEKVIKTDFEKRKAGLVTAYETTDVFGDDKMVTEFGKTTTKDAAGKVTYTGKYMALWEKRNGKWLVIRDMYNDDVKEK